MNKKSGLISQIFAIVLSISSIIALILNNVLIPYLDNHPSVKLAIILIGVFSAYHAFLIPTIRTIIQEELKTTNSYIEKADQKIEVLNNSIPYDSLDYIERSHGLQSKDVKNEVWIIANDLQEADQGSIAGENFLNTIYDNITKNNVFYYYILPDTRSSHLQIESFQNCLKQLHSSKRRKLSGNIYFRYDSSLVYLIPIDYFDIVLYIDCDQYGEPISINGAKSYEGYQCYSKKNASNKYYYLPINSERVLDLRCQFKESSSEQFSPIILE